MTDRRKPARKGLPPSLLPSFLGIKDELQQFQKSRSKTISPNQDASSVLG